MKNTWVMLLFFQQHFWMFLQYENIIFRYGWSRILSLLKGRAIIASSIVLLIVILAARNLQITNFADRTKMTNLQTFF